MSFLLVDAGATKTDFTLVVGKKISFRHSGLGINPNYSSDADIMRVFSDFVGSYNGEGPIEGIFYYGAGCASARNASHLEDLISKFFPCAHIEVYSDLVAVCHALSMGTASVVSILGTGSASCLFNGEEIVHRAPSLGYMLGDDGSGTNLGKRLLTAYLRGQLSPSLTAELEKTYDLNFEKVIHRIYKEPEPNQLMSQLAPFVQKHIDDAFIREMTLQAFNDFFITQKVHYPAYANLYWHLSGSVAYYFREVIKQAAEMQQCKLGVIVAAPMEKLIDYYIQKFSQVCKQ